MTDVDHLYALPLEEFTPARDAAAKEIRKGGDRETAAVVAKLPKPTPAAWTANQIAREQPDLMEAMLDAGETLREAQEAAVAGAGGQGMREATLAMRTAVDAVMNAAATYRPAGRALSKAMADRLRTTLNAAAGDEALREALAAGRLADEAQAGGAWPFALEPGDGPPPKPRRAKKKPAAKKPAAEDDKRAAEEEERRRAEEERRKALEAELKQAHSALRVRERVFAGAEHDARDAHDTVAQANAALEQAQKAAEDALADAETADRVLDEARNALQEARDTVSRLEERLG